MKLYVVKHKNFMLTKQVMYCKQIIVCKYIYRHKDVETAGNVLEQPIVRRDKEKNYMNEIF